METILAPVAEWAAAIGGMAVAIAVHLLASRAHASLVKAYGASLLAGLAAGLLVVFLLAPGAPLPGKALAAFLLFGSWWFVFMNFIQTSVSSLRVRILRELMSAGGACSRMALLERYSDRHLMDLRLDRLLQAGAVVERDGRLFVVSPALRATARFFRALKVIVLGRRSEFE